MASPNIHPSVHASAVLLGHRGILIRGPSGAGKSRLAMALLREAPFARLIGDDRIQIEAVHGRLLMRPTPALRGLIEVRGLGIRALPFEPVAVAHLVVDLAAEDAQRLPEPGALMTRIEGIALLRLPVAPGAEALAPVLACLRTGNAPQEPRAA